ncbi:MAG: alpha-amylase family glycosyl hydrolase [candidate division Zixibacteria bacterium]|nr:alpha-amylase family glycosyl hydrolase [candidate division Zixibacteria bacterium]
MNIDQTNLLKTLRNYFQFGFHLSRKALDWLEFPSLVNTPSSGAPASEIYLLRQLADRINEKRIHSAQLPDPIHAGQLASVSILVDLFRYIIESYCHEEQPGAIPRGLDWTGQQRGRFTVTRPPLSFVSLFPPISVLQGKQTENEYLSDSMSSPLVSDTIVREIMLLFISIANPAFRPFRILFDDTDLERESPYVSMVQGLERFFATQPPFRPVGLTLFECLFEPIRACPDSLEEQLAYIRQHWAHFLPLDLLERLLLAIDILEEENTLRGLGPGPSKALRFDVDTYGSKAGYFEPSAFSLDADWMSNVVLIAKSVYVWIYQLSRKYQRDIRLLSDIPDEELDRLAGWGFTGLWLIGLWERSSASQKIKQIMGNPEAVSSAYSLYDYVIAHDLGGEEAFQDLKHRAWRRGIRLASDMVPNHTGIYSKWVIEHPQWFLQTDYPPFPVYQYTGVDLSEDPRVCIQIEDGYWQHRDASVVFKRIDKWTGDTKYLLHGNDGTSMPWNDTAQMNFLLPEVREAVIQTILHVARQFPIIRFDAAMTLAKRHYQRLWFPEPGEGGAIPSRAEHGMTKEQFDALMPKEFWREVVDRIAQEVPDTLLLAEAFWLMEGYFVRTLGVHRVYNSAFMNMLKMEDNAKYRTTIKNVLEFSPEVLKRFVNFMNNPDELTAVEQFGRGDKYFGVAVMLVTMPGLPMIGHGQVEGFAEKYGMEYRRSYWDEPVDQEMVHRHETQIFPLMRRRHLFSGAANFAFYDFHTPDGWVDENVFAYSNRAGEERAIILYNNAYNTTRGHIHTSTQINIGDGDKTVLVRRTLSEALGLNNDDNCFYAFRNYQSGLEYIQPGRQLAEQGLFVELYAYQYNAFLDFREIRDTDGSWRTLEQRLAGAGVPNLDEAYRELQLEPILKPFRALMNSGMLRELLHDYPASRNQFRAAMTEFYASVGQFTGVTVKIEPFINQACARLDALASTRATTVMKEDSSASDTVTPQPEPPLHLNLDHVVLAWLMLEPLGLFRADRYRTPSSVLAAARAEQWLLQKATARAFEELLADSGNAYWDSRLVLILMAHSDLLAPANSRELGESFRQALMETAVQEYLQLHSFNNTLWVNKERLERMVDALICPLLLTARTDHTSVKINPADLRTSAQRLLSAADQAGYQVEKMLKILA